MVTAEGFRAALSLLESEDPTSEAQLREMLEEQRANPQQETNQKRPGGMHPTGSGAGMAAKRVKVERDESAEAARAARAASIAMSERERQLKAIQKRRGNR